MTDEKRKPGRPLGAKNLPAVPVSTQDKLEICGQGRAPRTPQERQFLKRFQNQTFPHQERALATWEANLERRRRRGDSGPRVVFNMFGVGEEHECGECGGTEAKVICIGCGRETEIKERSAPPEPVPSADSRAPRLYTPAEPCEGLPRPMTEDERQQAELKAKLERQLAEMRAGWAEEKENDWRRPL